MDYLATGVLILLAIALSCLAVVGGVYLIGKWRGKS